ncbi:MAG: hypothetical protein ACI9CZ_001780 [Flavobacterium sp.]
MENYHLFLLLVLTIKKCESILSVYEKRGH